MLFLIIFLLVLVSVGLVAASPWELSALDHNGNEINWNRLSKIGATYGAVSAIIAAIALLGVAASLVIQSHEAKAAHKNAHRYHADLLRMATDDPRYMECWGPYLTANFDTECQYVYVNLIVTQWHYEYEIGEMTDVLLRATAASMFASSPGRQYWEASGSFWRDNYPGRRAKRFFRVLNETYSEALKNPPSSPPNAVTMILCRTVKVPGLLGSGGSLPPDGELRRPWRCTPSDGSGATYGRAVADKVSTRNRSERS